MQQHLHLDLLLVLTGEVLHLIYIYPCPPAPGNSRVRHLCLLKHYRYRKLKCTCGVCSVINVTVARYKTAIARKEQIRIGTQDNLIQELID